MTKVEPSAPDLLRRVAEALSLPERGVSAVLALLAEGATVPFIARYRKERTGSLDEAQIRAIAEHHERLMELEARRATIRRSIDEQGLLTPELARRIAQAATRAELEDLYLPYRPKRRTKATVARERGLEPLAERILAQPRDGDPRMEARRFVAPGRDVPDIEAALAGARDIVVEVASERTDVRQLVRERLSQAGVLTSTAVKKKVKELGRTPFEDYYDYREPVARIPSHRFLAVVRGEAEGVLRARIEGDRDRFLGRIAQIMKHDPRSPFAPELLAALEEALDKRVMPAMESEVRAALKERADDEALSVFAENLRNLLLAAPFGARAVIGMDPGFRTGVKCAAIDATGRMRGHLTIHPFRGEDAEARAGRELLTFIRTHHPDAIAIGNGTAGRETDRFVRKALADAGLRQVTVVMVNEAGASVYSASDLARREFPDLDVTIRGAVCIARRLQDPLAELVKIDPKSIGVGQYQHDVHQGRLSARLSAVVESCVNLVGVELNTASAPLLAHVSGIGPKLAENIVLYREHAGAFENRRSLLAVKGLGPRAFEQAAGFLRVRESDHPLDRSAVHPERYAVVEAMARDLRMPLAELVGNPEATTRIPITRYATGDLGEPTLRDILTELAKPGRDPRAEFEPPRFREDVQTIDDLREGMRLEGVVTNVTAFGAFVDIGVHQDGLVHVSQLADRRVAQPSDVVKVGDRLRVHVLAVDRERGRISLSARTEAGAAKPPDRAPRDRAPRDRGPSLAEKAFGHTPFAHLSKRPKQS